MGSSVLLVDDSPLVRVATARVLGAHGLAVIAVASIEEAVACDATCFHAALLDLELGDGLGTQVAARLRDAAPALPIAFLTGGGPEETVDAARRFGPVFSKTADFDEAIAWVVASSR